MKTRIFFLGSLLLLLCLYSCNKEELQPPGKTSVATENETTEKAVAKPRSDNFDVCDCRMRLSEVVPTDQADNLPQLAAVAPVYFTTFSEIIQNPEAGVWYNIQLVQGEPWRFALGDGTPVAQESVVLDIECPDKSIKHTFVRQVDEVTGWGFFGQLKDVVSNCPDCNCTLDILSATTMGPEEEVIIRGQIKQSYEGGSATKFGGEIVELPISVPFEHVGDSDVGLYFFALYYDEEDRKKYPVTSITFNLSCGNTESGPQTIFVGSVDELTPIPYELDVFVTDDCVVSVDPPCNCTVSVDKIDAYQGVNIFGDQFGWTLNSPNEKSVNLAGNGNTIYPKIDQFSVLPNSNFFISMKATLSSIFPVPEGLALSMQVSVNCGGSTATEYYLFGSSGQKYDGSTFTVVYNLEEGCEITETEAIF